MLTAPLSRCLMKIASTYARGATDEKCNRRSLPTDRTTLPSNAGCCLHPIPSHIVSLHEVVEYIDTWKNSILWKKIQSSLFQRFLFYISSNVKLCAMCYRCLLCIFEAHHAPCERCSQIQMHKQKTPHTSNECIIHVDALVSATVALPENQ